MPSYNAEFEGQLALYRRRQRLLVANNISFKATVTDFEIACRARLSQPNTVRFFWRTPEKSWNKNRGWVMLGFELRTDCRRALEELKDFEFRGRKIGVHKAGRQAYAPSTQPTAPNAAAPTTATYTTTTTTTNTSTMIAPPAAAPAPAATSDAPPATAAATTTATSTTGPVARWGGEENADVANVSDAESVLSIE